LNAVDNRPTVILGSGGHAKVVAEALIQSGHEILGFLTPEKKPGTEFYGFNILGDDEVIKAFSPDEVVLANGVGLMPRQSLRWRLANHMRELGFSFATVVHPSATLASDVELAEGAQIMMRSILQAGVKIGRDSIINSGALLDHDCSIAENCHLAPGVVCSGGVEVSAGAFVGAGTIITQNISVGRNAIVAAGSTIYSDVPTDVTFMQTREARTSRNES